MIDAKIGIAAAAVIALLGWMLLHAHGRIGELEVKLKKQTVETEEAADANTSNQATIADLEARIQTMIDERRAETEAREQALVARERELTQARAEADRLREARDDEAQTNLECGDFNALVLSDFCPDTARQLRERSRGPGGDENPDRDGAGGGV